MLLPFASLLGIAAAGTVNLTNLKFDPKLVDLGKFGGINPGVFKPLDPSLFKGVDLSGIDLSKVHTAPNLLLKDRPLKTIRINDALFGNRPVSYYVTSNNLAVIDGDVIYGPVSSLLSHSGSTRKEKRAFSGQPAWPNANVIYKYDSASTASKIKPLVDAAIGDWQTAAPWLRFSRQADSAAATNGVLTITSNDCDGCNANYGYNPNAPRFMNLGTNSACGDSCGSPVALHEFGHVLGLYHEHQRPDRDAHVQYHCENLAPLCNNGKFMKINTNCCNNLEGDCCGHASDFNFIADNALDWSGPYDINSVMHYPGGLFSIAGQNTLTSSPPNPPVPVFNTGTISAGDLDRVCRRHVLECKPICKELQCPPPCQIIRPCPTSHGCRPPRENDHEWQPPACCELGELAELNAACKARKANCRAHACPSGPS